MSAGEGAAVRGVRRRLVDRMFVRGRIEDVRPAPGRMRWIRVGGVPGGDRKPGQQGRVPVGAIPARRTGISGAGSSRREPFEPEPFWPFEAAWPLPARVRTRVGMFLLVTRRAS